MSQYQGTLEDRYRIYCECMEAMGKTPISFDEWLNTGRGEEVQLFVEWLYANLEVNGFFPVDHRCERYAKRLGIPQARWQKVFNEECEKVNPRKDIAF